MEMENQSKQSIQSVQNVQEEDTIDLLELFYELKKRVWLILMTAVIGAGIAGVFSKVVLTPQYVSTATMYVLSKETTLTTLADLQIGTQLTQDYKVLITSRPVMEGVIDELGLDMSYKTLKSRLSIANPNDTRILTISIQDPDPQMAKAIVDEVSKQASEFIGDVMEMQAPKIVEDGEISFTKVSPNTKKNVMLGALAGAFLVCAVIVVMTLLNDTIQTEEDVEKYLGLYVLANVPDRQESSSHKKKKHKKGSDKDLYLSRQSEKGEQ